MLSGVQTPHDKYDICGIVHAGTNRKDDIFMQRRLVQNFTFILEWGQGTCSLTKHTRRLAYSWYLFPACCLLRTTLCGIFIIQNGLRAMHSCWDMRKTVWNFKLLKSNLLKQMEVTENYFCSLYNFGDMKPKTLCINNIWMRFWWYMYNIRV